MGCALAEGLMAPHLDKREGLMTPRGGSMALQED